MSTNGMCFVRSSITGRLSTLLPGPLGMAASYFTLIPSSDAFIAPYHLSALWVSYCIGRGLAVAAFLCVLFCRCLCGVTSLVPLHVID